MPSSFTHGLLPTSCVLASKPALPKLTRWETLKLLFVTMVLGNACDLDLIPAFSVPSRWLEIHRYWGHNIFAITVWILLGRWVLTRYVSRKLTSSAAWILSLSLVFSHVLFDSMGDYSGKGVRVGVPLLWPFSHWEFILPFPVFKGIRIDPKLHPALAHITSVSFWSEGIFREFYASVVLFATYCALFYGVRFFSKLAQKGFRFGPSPYSTKRTSL